IYMLGMTYNPSTLPAVTTVLGQASGADSFVLKLSPNGKQIVYLTALGFVANAMAVDAAGGVYIAGTNTVGKLNPTGTAWVYQMTAGVDVSLVSLAADAAGHAYVLGFTAPGGSIQTTARAFQQTEPNTTYQHQFVLRLNAAGTAFDYATYLTSSQGEIPGSIAADLSGAAIVSGITTSTDFPTTPGAYQGQAVPSLPATFLTRLLPDGAALIYSALPAWVESTSPIAVDPDGNAVLAVSGGPLLRFSPQGTLTFSKPNPGIGALATTGIGALALDTAGNIYGLANANAGYVVSNSLFPCQPSSTALSSTALTMLDSGGTVLQSTYLPQGTQAATLALGPDSQVYVSGYAYSPFVPTQAIAGASPDGCFLARFSQNPAAQPVQLACIGNAASFNADPVAGGEIVALFGQGLGPAQGTQPQVTLESGFPDQVSDVQVTFNGTAGPLLYVQDGQINAIVPWSLATASTAEICVSYKGTKTNCLDWPVASAAPGVFTVDGVHAAALNQDGTINSAENPAAPGSIVSVFATGLGPVNPPQLDGAIVKPPLPVNDLQFQAYFVSGFLGVGIVPLETQYAGPAPYLVAGASQINFVALDILQLDSLAVQLFGLSTSAESNAFVVYVSGI
ncbi:MAG: hypothetical protein ABSH32_09665, partial [Bryobacteraceae bacterium]